MKLRDRLFSDGILTTQRDTNAYFPILLSLRRLLEHVISVKGCESLAICRMVVELTTITKKSL
jgi:hypothetical protein